MSGGGVEPRRLPGKGWRPRAVRTTPFGAALALWVDGWIEENLPSLIEPSEPQDAFGRLQPLFPDWRNNLRPSLPSGPGGLCTFKVSFGSAWRRLRVPAHLALSGLADAILDAFNVDYEHLYLFSYRDPFFQVREIHHPYTEESPDTDETAIGDLPIRPGDHRSFLYDFGDNRNFDILFEQEALDDGKQAGAVMIERRGRAPKQYRAEW